MDPQRSPAANTAGAVPSRAAGQPAIDADNATRAAGAAAVWRRRLRTMAMLALVLACANVRADPPGRVGRLADTAGSVRWFDTQVGHWAEALRNQPLTEGDRMVTGPGSRAVIDVGSSTLRLGERTEVAFTRLDDDGWRMRLTAGRVALHVRNDGQAAEVVLDAGGGRLLPGRAGHYRLDVSGGRLVASAWAGSATLEADGLRRRVDEGDRIEAWREPGSGTVRIERAWGESDEFSRWALREVQDEVDARHAAIDPEQDSRRHVSPEMTGWQDLDRHGRWSQHPEYGAFWMPAVVPVGWAPYRDGRWMWVKPWGWTWVDRAPWGFAPFHYGRWVSWRGRWGWAPGRYAARPVYSPALVVWLGGDNWSGSVRIGPAPRTGWVALAPHQPYRPRYRASPIYLQRIQPVYGGANAPHRSTDRRYHADDWRGHDRDDHRRDRKDHRDDHRRDPRDDSWRGHRGTEGRGDRHDVHAERGPGAIHAGPDRGRVPGDDRKERKDRHDGGGAIGPGLADGGRQGHGWVRPPPARAPAAEPVGRTESVPRRIGPSQAEGDSRGLQGGPGRSDRNSAR